VSDAEEARRAKGSGVHVSVRAQRRLRERRGVEPLANVPVGRVRVGQRLIRPLVIGCCGAPGPRPRPQRRSCRRERGTIPETCQFDANSRTVRSENLGSEYTVDRLKLCRRFLLQVDAVTPQTGPETFRMGTRDNRNRDQLLGPGVDAVRPSVVSLHGEAAGYTPLRGQEKAVISSWSRGVFLYDLAKILALSRIQQIQLTAAEWYCSCGTRRKGGAVDCAGRSGTVTAGLPSMRSEYASLRCPCSSP